MSKDLSEGLVLDLNMETLEDYSGNSNDGVATGTSLTTDKNGRLNQARSFNGSSDIITCPNMLDSLSAVSEFSIRIRFKPSSLSGGEVVWSRGSNNNFYLYFFSTGQIRFFCFDSSTGIDSTGNHVITTDYQTITVVKDGATSGKIYYNGIEVSSSGNTGSLPSFSSEDFVIGSYFDSNFDFTGDVDSSVRVWNRALSADEAYQDFAEISHNYAGLFDGLVAGYDFKNNAKDFSGNGNDGIVTGVAPTTDYLGIVNSAYSFNGSSDYIQSISSTSFPTSFTVSVWVKHLTSDVYDTMMGIDKAEGGAAGLLYLQKASNNHWRCTVTNTTNTQFWAESDSTYTDTNWHHIVGTYDDSTKSVKLYVDSVLQSTSPTLTGTRATPNGNLEIGAGWYNNAITDFFNGSISNTQIWNRVLSADEVKTFYDLTKVGYIYPFPKDNYGGVTQ